MVPNCNLNPAACNQANICSVVSCLPGEACFQCKDPSGYNTSGTAMVLGTLQLSAFSSQGRTSEGSSAQVIVYVIDQSTGRKVAIAQTDEEGNFMFDQLPAGTYALFVLAPGYVMPSSQQSISVGDGEQVAVDIRSNGRLLEVARTTVITALDPSENGQADHWYPVPNRGDTFYLDSAVEGESVQMNVYNLLGERVRSPAAIDRSGGQYVLKFRVPLVPGFYIFSWTSAANDELYSQKIVVRP
jgi:hypothetical protein